MKFLTPLQPKVQSFTPLEKISNEARGVEESGAKKAQGKPRSLARVVTGLTTAKTFALDILFPESCVSCAREGQSVCSSCENLLTPIPPTCIVCKKFSPGKNRDLAGKTCPPCREKTAISHFFSPFSYQSKPVNAIIHSLKYKRVRSLASVVAEMLGNYLLRFHIFVPAGAVLVPVPLHPRRKRRRGFNQSELIARDLGAILGIPLESLLFRSRPTHPQTSLDYAARRANVENAFSAHTSTKYKLAILVDDVKTTGATLDEAARALKKAGIKRVWAITFAH